MIIAPTLAGDPHKLFKQKKYPATKQSALHLTLTAMGFRAGDNAPYMDSKLGKPSPYNNTSTAPMKLVRKQLSQHRFAESAKPMPLNKTDRVHTFSDGRKTPTFIHVFSKPDAKDDKVRHAFGLVRYKPEHKEESAVKPTASKAKAVYAVEVCDLMKKGISLADALHQVLKSNNSTTHANTSEVADEARKLYKTYLQSLKTESAVAKKPGIGHNHPPKTKERFIEKDTPILPHMIAEQVASEAARHTKSDKPLKHVKYLADKAHTIYNKNTHFAKKVRGRGNGGRDYLYMFMRHWISSKIKKDNPELHSKIPAAFSNGQEVNSSTMENTVMKTAEQKLASLSALVKANTTAAVKPVAVEAGRKPAEPMKQYKNVREAYADIAANSKSDHEFHSQMSRYHRGQSNKAHEALNSWQEKDGIRKMRSLESKESDHGEAANHHDTMKQSANKKKDDVNAESRSLGKQIAKGYKGPGKETPAKDKKFAAMRESAGKGKSAMDKAANKAYHDKHNKTAKKVAGKTGKTSGAKSPYAHKK